MATRTTIRDIPLAQITPDSGQPRKRFDKAALRELADSIKQSGLLQPITVRPVGPKAFIIIAGERRFRASQLLEAPTIRAIVSEDDDAARIRVLQIIENDQRVDVSPLEQAHSYHGLMTEAGWTAEQLAEAIGKAPYRIQERLVLLNLQPEYQQLLATGALSPKQAFEMARLSHRGQDKLFKAIGAGQCNTTADLKVAAKAILAMESQASLLGDETAPPSEETVELATGFEKQVDRIAALLRSGITDNQIIAVRKTNPHKAGHLADLLAAMQRDMRRIEVALRTVAIQADLLPSN